MSAGGTVDARLILLSGEEDALRRRAIAEHLSAVGLVAGDFDVAELDGSCPISTWIAQAGTVPFLADRRVVIVRQLLRAEPDQARLSDLAALPASALIILVADEETGDESRQSRLKTLKKGWEKLVNDAKGVVQTFEVAPRQLQASIKEESKRLGKTISDRSVALLAEMVGGSLSRSMEELEKLALFVGESPAISEGDMRTLVVTAREWNVFKLSDAVVRNDMAEAIKQLRVLVASPAKAEDAAFRSILPQLSRQFKLLWQGRMCVEAKVGPSQAPASLTANFPSKPNLTKEPEFRQGAIMSAARKVSFPRLARCLQLVADADAKLKGQLPSFSAMETLETMVLEMGNAFAA